MGKKTARPVHTIGHSDMEPEKFIETLERHGIQGVIDVRTTPYSRHAPQFNRERLAGMLSQRGIIHTPMGDRLGGRPRENRLYDEKGRVQYNLMALENDFQEGIEQVARMSEIHRLALLCTERDPLKCHRTLLVSRALEEREIQVIHILGTGKAESHEELMSRLLTMWRLPRQGEAGTTRRQMLEQAVTNQARQVAYRRRL